MRFVLVLVASALADDSIRLQMLRLVLGSNMPNDLAPFVLSYIPRYATLPEPNYVIEAFETDGTRDCFEATRSTENEMIKLPRSSRVLVHQMEAYTKTELFSWQTIRFEVAVRGSKAPKIVQDDEECECEIVRENEFRCSTHDTSKRPRRIFLQTWDHDVDFVLLYRKLFSSMRCEDTLHPAIPFSGALRMDLNLDFDFAELQLSRENQVNAVAAYYSVQHYGPFGMSGSFEVFSVDKGSVLWTNVIIVTHIDSMGENCRVEAKGVQDELTQEAPCVKHGASLHKCEIVLMSTAPVPTKVYITFSDCSVREFLNYSQYLFTRQVVNR